MQIIVWEMNVKLDERVYTEIFVDVMLGDASIKKTTM